MALQFDTAVPSGSPASNCVVCKKPIGDSYYTAGKAIVCANCKTGIEGAPRPAATPAQIARATVFGIGGAIAGAALYYGVLALTHFELALIAIAVGWLVGRAMQYGSGGQRGQPFQTIAVVLTYLGISAGYASWLMRGTWSFDPVALLTLPIQVSIDHLPTSLITALIIAIGLRQAWFMTRDPGRPVFHGPFRIGAQA